MLFRGEGLTLIVQSHLEKEKPEGVWYVYQRNRKIEKKKKSKEVYRMYDIYTRRALYG
jgi:hypothetical protein